MNWYWASGLTGGIQQGLQTGLRLSDLYERGKEMRAKKQGDAIYKQTIADLDAIDAGTFKSPEGLDTTGETPLTLKSKVTMSGFDQLTSLGDERRASALLTRLDSDVGLAKRQVDYGASQRDKMMEPVRVLATVNELPDPVFEEKKPELLSAFNESVGGTNLVTDMVRSPEGLRLMRGDKLAGTISPKQMKRMSLVSGLDKWSSQIRPADVAKVQAAIVAKQKEYMKMRELTPDLQIKTQLEQQINTLQLQAMEIDRKYGGVTEVPYRFKQEGINFRGATVREQRQRVTQKRARTNALGRFFGTENGTSLAVAEATLAEAERIGKSVYGPDWSVANERFALDEEEGGISAEAGGGEGGLDLSALGTGLEEETGPGEGEMTEEELTDLVRQYKADPRYAGYSDEELRDAILKQLENP